MLISPACEDGRLADNWQKGSFGSHGDGRRGCSVVGRNQGKKDRHTSNRQMSCLCFQQPVVLSDRCWAWGAIELAQLVGEMVPGREPLG